MSEWVTCPNCGGTPRQCCCSPTFNPEPRASVQEMGEWQLMANECVKIVRDLAALGETLRATPPELRIDVIASLVERARKATA